MSQAPSMPLYVDALIGDTMHLSVDEFGAYCLLLFATWRNNGKALKDDDRELARICRMSLARWRQSMRPKLVAFFRIDKTGWHQKRLEKEWEYVHSKRTTLANSLALAREAKALKKANGGLSDETSNQSSNELCPTTSPINLDNKYNNPSSAHVHAREGGNGKLNLEIDPGGRYAPLRGDAAPLRGKALAQHRKDQLVQKLMRFTIATMPEKPCALAIEGLTGLDTAHSAQWWLDTLDQQMRAAKWDDTE